MIFTGRGQAHAHPAARTYTYRGRCYTGTVHLSGPGWEGSTGLGLTRCPAGTPAGRVASDTIARIIGAAHLHGHPGVLDAAELAHARAQQARAARDLHLLTIEIRAAEEHLAALRRKEATLRAIAGPSRQPAPPSTAVSASSPRPPQEGSDA